MTKIREFYRKHQVMVPFVIIVVISLIGFGRIEAAAKERKHQICTAEIEDRILFEDILKFSEESQTSSQIDLTTLPPELQQLIEESQANSEAFYSSANEKLDIPPEICNGTGITEAQIREKQEVAQEE